MLNWQNILVGAAIMSASSNAHITMHSPAPFSPRPDNSPLSTSGSDFPCKIGSGLQSRGTTRYAANQPMQVTFEGSAVHAGGSCQISLSKDGAATLNARSTFKVIYSIMGGCPGADGGTSKYSIRIPKEVPSGEYTLAWTWFNKIGNREMYMNCAPVAIEGGSGDEAGFMGLPDMAVFNIAGKNDCGTTEMRDVRFPEPGRYVEVKSSVLAPPTGSCARGGGSGGVYSPPGGYIGDGPPNQSPQQQQQQPSFPGLEVSGSSYSGSSSGSNSGNSNPSGFIYPGLAAQSNFGSKGSDSGAYKNNPSPTALSNNNLYTPSPSPPKPSPSQPVPQAIPPNNAALEKVAPPAPKETPLPVRVSATPADSATATIRDCASDGAVVCNSDGTQFGLCNFGRVRFMAVSMGTMCRNGAISRRNVWAMRG